MSNESAKYFVDFLIHAQWPGSALSSIADNPAKKSIKVLTIGISRNALPILIIVLPIPIPILIEKKYCNTLAILKTVLAILPIPIQYCNSNNPV